MRLGFFLREAMRSVSRNAVPSFAALASVLVTVLVLGVFIPIVQATTGAANEVRERVIVDVYLKPRAAADQDVERVRRTLAEDTPYVGNVKYVSKEEAYAAEKRRNPEAYELLGSNPLPDTFRVTPDEPENVGALRDALAPSAEGGGAARPGDRRGQEPPRGHGQDPLGHARREAHDGGAHGAAHHRVDPARREHDPAVAVRAPARGRGHAPRRRDELVHPLAVHHRGRDPRRDGRRPRDPAAARRARSR